MRRAALAMLLLAGAAGPALGDEAADAAIALFRAKRYAEARRALAAVAQREPGNAEVCYCLGMALRHDRAPQAIDRAAPWLEKAVRLAPENPAYLADFAGNCLELADEHRSYSLAKQGRDAMEKALRGDPANLDGHFGLVQFNAQAPWPLGTLGQAFAHAEAIARRDRSFGLRAYLWLGNYFASHRKASSARRAFQAALRLDPANRAAQAALQQLR